MSKINQIQNALRAMDGGAFQKLADSYLRKKDARYGQINPLGSVVGKDKVKTGTPDTLIPLPNGKYVFAEHTTTSKERLFAKIKDDLDKCFDEKKTGIPIGHIEEVAFCHTSELSPDELNELRERCEKEGVNLNIFGIGPISYDLLEKYPGLARDYLGVEVDTGQIVPPDEFVSLYGKNKLATRLDTIFRFREQELEKVLDALERGDLVIISGRPGVGKSRLAIECAKRFQEKHNDYEVRCIFNRGPDLFEDLRIHFSAPGKFIILVDDANRVSRFDYVIQLLQGQREDQEFKVIATVRDYALERIREITRQRGSSVELDVQPFSDDQIRKLVEVECEIKNHIYLERIANIAQGNPRLAMMAAEVAKQHQSLESINDASDLYDRYFASVKQDLRDLGTPDLLRVAGIVAFFRVVDRSDESLMNGISGVFGISDRDFWQTVERLHDLELCDIYENEVVRVSDQVLGTYLFYLAFFKERVLNFGSLLENFFPQFRQRLVDSLNPVLNTFDSQAILDELRPHVDRAWSALETENDTDGLVQLMQVFWYLKQTETLLFVHDAISAMKEAANPETSNTGSTSGISRSPLLDTLRPFQYAEDEVFRMAVDMVCDYVAARPGERSQVLTLLTDNFGFKHDSYRRAFSIQRIVIEVLQDRTKRGDNHLFSELFYAVAEKYLHTEFHTTETGRGNEFRMITFRLSSSPDLTRIRQAIWTYLFQLFDEEDLRPNILKVLQSYSTSGFDISSSDVIKEDAALVIPFVESKLDPSDFRHCLVVHEYLDRLESHNVPFDHELRERFNTDTFALYDLLSYDRAERRYLDLKYDEYEELRKQRIREYAAEVSAGSIKNLIDSSACISNHLELRHEAHQVSLGLERILISIADQDPALFIDGLTYYLKQGDRLNVPAHFLIKELIKHVGRERAHEMLGDLPSPTRRKWLAHFLTSLVQEEINSSYIEEICNLYREADSNELPYGLDHLLVYQQVDEQVVLRVTSTLIDRSEEDPGFAFKLSFLFNSHSEINKALRTLFSDNTELLKQAYLTVLGTDNHADHDGKSFNTLLDLDMGFAVEYIDWMYGRQEWLSSHHDNRDYSFLWKRGDFGDLMTQVANRVFEHEKDHIFFFQNYFSVFFKTRSDADLEYRQDEFLRGLIEQNYQDGKFMQFVFGALASFSAERRRSLLALFLDYNKRFEDFKALPLEPNSWSGSPSLVPAYQVHLEYLTSLLPLLNTVEFLRHKQYVEAEIKQMRKRIEAEKKQNFMEDY